MKVVYHPGFVFGSSLINRLHPFEFNRATLAVGGVPEARLVGPSQALGLDELECVHDKAYLAALHKSSTISKVVEVGLLKFLPSKVVSTWFLEPALWNTAGTLLAAQVALEEGLAISVGGGFHHACRSHGEGFCLINDIAYLIEVLRRREQLGGEETILYVDLDAHQGNGVSDYYGNDPNVVLLDIYNEGTYPVYGTGVPPGIDIALPVSPGCSDEVYLETLESGLERLPKSASLLIYNAGTDIYEGDRIGGLAVSREGVLERDKMVLEFARDAGIPTVCLASGGYSLASAGLISAMIDLAERRFR